MISWHVTRDQRRAVFLYGRGEIDKLLVFTLPTRQKSAKELCCNNHDRNWTASLVYIVRTQWLRIRILDCCPIVRDIRRSRTKSCIKDMGPYLDLDLFKMDLDPDGILGQFVVRDLPKKDGTMGTIDPFLDCIWMVDLDPLFWSVPTSALLLPPSHFQGRGVNWVLARKLHSMSSQILHISPRIQAILQNIRPALYRVNELWPQNDRKKIREGSRLEKVWNCKIVVILQRCERKTFFSFIPI